MYPQEFIDALMAFITFIATTQSGGNMLLSAGLVQLLVRVFAVKSSASLKVNYGISIISV